MTKYKPKNTLNQDTIKKKSMKNTNPLKLINTKKKSVFVIFKITSTNFVCFLFVSKMSFFWQVQGNYKRGKVYPRVPPNGDVASIHCSIMGLRGWWNQFDTACAPKTEFCLCEPMRPNLLFSLFSLHPFHSLHSLPTNGWVRSPRLSKKERKWRRFHSRTDSHERRPFGLATGIARKFPSLCARLYLLHTYMHAHAYKRTHTRTHTHTHAHAHIHRGTDTHKHTKMHTEYVEYLCCMHT